MATIIVLHIDDDENVTEVKVSPAVAAYLKSLILTDGGETADIPTQAELPDILDALTN